MPSFTTINPKNSAPLKTYDYMQDAEVRRLIDASHAAYRHWQSLSIQERVLPIARLGDLLKREVKRLATLATDEMGKPISQAHKEIEKCALTCHFYAEQAEAMLRETVVKTAATKSYVTYRPLGPVLGIMPWNFPYWQAIRFAIPTMAAGNTIVLKHADNTTGVSLELEKLCQEAGFPESSFRALVLNHERIGSIIRDPLIRAVSLTGSEQAGSSVAAIAGASLKKTVLELGGSDAFIVLQDADIEHAAGIAVDARYQNSGQSCIAAKRFIVEALVYRDFVDAFVAKTKQKNLGDPADAKTDIGPLAKASIRAAVDHQVQASRKAGAMAILGGQALAGPGFYFEPTVLESVTPGMPAFDEEVFGPVAAMIKATDANQALELANRSRFGLGGVIFSRDTARAEALAALELDAGFTVVNGMVQSDPHLPFGGIKNSGYGRELAWFGLHEFVNAKTVVVQR